MDSKHLTEGDFCPPLKEGKLRIYSMRFCPYAQRVLLVAAAKKIEYDIVNINLRTKPEFMYSKNPSGKVPTLELVGVGGGDSERCCLYESLIICDYLDEMYPDVSSQGDSEAFIERLNSKFPLQKAKDRIWIEQFSNSVMKLDNQALMLPPESSDEEIKAVLKELVASLQPFEDELAIRNTNFFAGSSKPGMIDYMMWPCIERLPSLGLLWGSNFDLKSARGEFTLLNAWEERMIKDPAVQESYLSPDIHFAYRMSKKRGNQDYDFLIQ